MLKKKIFTFIHAYRLLFTPPHLAASLPQHKRFLRIRHLHGLNWKKIFSPLFLYAPSPSLFSCAATWPFYRSLLFRKECYTFDLRFSAGPRISVGILWWSTCTGRLRPLSCSTWDQCRGGCIDSLGTSSVNNNTVVVRTCLAHLMLMWSLCERYERRNIVRF